MFALVTSDACASDEQICEGVLEWTGNDDLANAADVLVGKPLTLLGLALLGLVARWVLHRLVDRLVARAAGVVLPAQVGRWARLRRRGTTAAEAAESAREFAATTRREQRAKTLGDLLKSVITGVIVAIVATMMLSELGVNIAPIIASAGIAGIALGFGAQSLVKDYISGIFMMAEDQYGVGDVVDLGEANGTVEAVTLRVTRLRDVNGTVWYVRNGEIVRVGNMSQNWSRAVVDVSVGYAEDLARVKSVLRDVADDLWRDDDFGERIIEEPEVTGVEVLAANSVTLRVMVKTLPMEQWAVGRELRQRIKSRFDAEGIEIPYAQRVIYQDERGQPVEADAP
jgi:moderate conductance mechanosensitive channel